MLLLDCSYPEWILKWIDLCKYPLPQLITAGLGELLWAIVYILVIRDAIRNKYVQIPGGIVAVNLAWEFLAGFVYPPLAGKLMSLGFQLWFGMDLIIFALTLRYGHRQLPPGESIRYYKTIIVSIFATALLLMYLYFDQGSLEQHYSIAAYLINLFMSAYFLLNLIQLKVWKFMSETVGRLKMLGTAITTISVLISKDPLEVVVAMGFVVLALDILYIVVLRKEKRTNRIIA